MGCILPHSSHANSAPPAVLLPLCCAAVCRELGRLLRVNVMGYDYTGYGVSSGQPSTAATCCDISTVLQCLELDHGIKRQAVVLYGQSVGSGPTVSCESVAQQAAMDGGGQDHPHGRRRPTGFRVLVGRCMSAAAHSDVHTPPVLVDQP